MNYSEVIKNNNISIFENIESQTSSDDRKSLLSIQNLIRENNYCYLEIGSYLGGTLQPHYVDQKCTKIYSIDLRPSNAKDERGVTYDYSIVTSEDMKNNLRKNFPDINKEIECFDTSSSKVDVDIISKKPNLIFIDGEHTHDAVFLDFKFSLDVCNKNCTILFHDSHYVFKGLKRIKKYLSKRKINFRFFKLGGSVSVILLNDHISKYSHNISKLSIDENKYFYNAKKNLMKLKYINKYPLIYSTYKKLKTPFILKEIDHHGERLDLEVVGFKEFMHHIIRYKFASEYSLGSVLDIACGTGYGSYFLSDNHKINNITGVDLSNYAISRAITLFNDPKINFLVGDATKTEFDSDKFDTIVSFETVEHVEDLSKYFDEIIRIIKINGTYICSVPNKKFYQDAGIKNEFHFNEMYYDNFKKNLSKYFSDIKIYYQLFPEIKNNPIKNDNSFIKGLKNSLKYILPNFIVKAIRNQKIINKSVYYNYGYDIEKFLSHNKNLAKEFKIIELVDKVYEKKMGNFLAICKSPKQTAI